MTATFLSLLMLVSFILPGHRCSGACGIKVDISSLASQFCMVLRLALRFGPLRLVVDLVVGAIGGRS